MRQGYAYPRLHVWRLQRLHETCYCRASGTHSESSRQAQGKLNTRLSLSRHPTDRLLTGTVSSCDYPIDGYGADRYDVRMRKASAVEAEIDRAIADPEHCLHALAAAARSKA